VDIKRVYFVMGIGILGVSFAAIFIRLSDAPSSVIAMYRMLITFILFTPFIMKKKGMDLNKIGKKSVLLAILSGFFLALHFIAWIESLKHTTIASSTVLVSLQPLFTSLLGFMIYKERMNMKQGIGMIVAITGSFVIGFGDFMSGGGNLYGDALAILGGVFAALYVIIGRGLRKTISNLDYVYMAYGSCTLVLFSVNLLWRVPILKYDASEWLIFLGLAIFSTIGGHTIFNWSLKYVEANRVSMAMLGEPIGATLLGLLILQEIPSNMQFISAGIILIGLYLFMQASFKKERNRRQEGQEL